MHSVDFEKVFPTMQDGGAGATAESTGNYGDKHHVQVIETTHPENEHNQYLYYPAR